MPAKSFYSGSSFSSDDDAADEWDWPAVLFSPADWDAIYSDPHDIPVCTICDERIDDRRFCCAFQILKSWSPNSVQLRFAHVECLRRVMHPHHKLH